MREVMHQMFHEHGRVRLRGAAAVGCGMICMSLAVPVAHASPDNGPVIAVNSSDTQAISSFLSENGVSQTQVDAILTNLENGILPDSDNGSSPVSTATTTVGQVSKTVDTYADGSVSVVEAPVIPSGSAGSAQLLDSAVTGCKKIAAHMYQNCYAQAKNVGLTLSFRFNFGPDKITKAWDGAYATRAVTFSDAHFVWKSATVEEYGGTECLTAYHCEPAYIKVGVTRDHATAGFSNS